LLLFCLLARRNTNSSPTVATKSIEECGCHLIHMLRKDQDAPANTSPGPRIKCRRRSVTTATGTPSDINQRLPRQTAISRSGWWNSEVHKLTLARDAVTLETLQK
jgi:hypothetical protein